MGAQIGRYAGQRSVYAQFLHYSNRRYAILQNQNGQSVCAKQHCGLSMRGYGQTKDLHYRFAASV
uniref:Lef-4 protein n=1 Tax=Autographa californica nuclear polyhedrosis virus TaxID=46015 RepID=Q65347_NPVAC|nr:7.3 kDa protein; putative [Autographa californica nucleopolyhedrovirus]